MRKTILILALLMFGGCGSAAEDLNMNQLVGLWEVDFDRTMEESEKSPKYDENTAQHMPDMIRSMMAMMKIKLTDDEMVYLQGAKKMVLPYTVQSSDEKSVTVIFKQGLKETPAVFTLIDGKYMNFTSSTSDDMNYYIWKKATNTP